MLQVRMTKALAKLIEGRKPRSRTSHRKHALPEPEGVDQPSGAASEEKTANNDAKKSSVESPKGPSKGKSAGKAKPSTKPKAESSTATGAGEETEISSEVDTGEQKGSKPGAD